MLMAPQVFRSISDEWPCSLESISGKWLVIFSAAIFLYPQVYPWLARAAHGLYL